MSTPSSIKTIGVLGANGLLGGDLVRLLRERFDVRGITRENYGASRGAEFDVLVNANGNSRRFWANRNILADFEASTASVYKSLFDFRFKKYIYISSSDVYPEHGNPEKNNERIAIDPQKISPYGFHKYLSEMIIKKHVSDFLILRSSMILGSALKKGPVYDILHGNELFITLDSRLQFITTRAVAAVIENLLAEDARRETFNMGGKGSLSFRYIGTYLKEPTRISHDAECQEYEMDISKLSAIYPLKTSEVYLKEFIDERNGS